MGSLYKQEVSKYDKKDGVIALCYFVYIVVAISVINSFNLPLTGLPRVLFGFVLFTAPCIAIVLIRKQGLASIGFHKKNFWPALCTCLAFSALVLVVYGNLIPGILQGWELRSANSLVNEFVRTLFNAAWEDIVMMGFILTRIYGLIKKDTLAIAVVALLFGIKHLPMQLINHGTDYLGIGLMFDMVGWTVAFVVWSLIFKRYFSIIPIILLHTMWNFSGRIWLSRGQGLSDEVGFAIMALSIIAWALISHYRTRKISAE